MTQEIKVNLTLTIEGDIQKSKTDIENFVSELVNNLANTKSFSLIGYRINRIQEEAEIYLTNPQGEESLWEFVAKYYPAYHCCDEILRNDDLCKILDGERNADAGKIFKEQFSSDLDSVRIAFEESTRKILERAILGYQQSQQESITIHWGVIDVEERASFNGYRLKKGEAQKVLEMIRKTHDCNVGITWELIDSCLSYIVPDSLEDDGIEWTPIRFNGKEYLARLLPDPHYSNSIMLIAPITLYHAMDISSNKEAELLDESVAYYASQEEMAMLDEELLKLIYG